MSTMGSVSLSSSECSDCTMQESLRQALPRGRLPTRELTTGRRGMQSERVAAWGIPRLGDANPKGPSSPVRGIPSWVATAQAQCGMFTGKPS